MKPTSPVSPSKSESPKFKLSDFDLIRTLGSGSFGKVKYARSKVDNQYYAVKLMKKHEIIKMKQGMPYSVFMCIHVCVQWSISTRSDQLCSSWIILS